MRVAVLLCGRLAPPAAATGNGVTVVPDLCAHPGVIAEAAGGADRLVLGVCSGDHSLARLQAEARRAGIDPLGMELVALEDAAGDPERLSLLTAAAAARARAFAGSEPQHAKIAFPREVRRRDLVRALRPEYRAAPHVAPDVCEAGAGCRACVDACPRQAYRWVDGRIEYDRAVCEPCGICVTTCPAGAITNPAATPAQVEAQLWALLDPAAGPPGPRGIAFVCSQGDARVAAPGWYGVRVPCTAMVTAPWLLAPLLLGAGSVALLPCGGSGCPLGLDPVARATLEFATVLLGGLGAAERARAGAGGPVPEAWDPVPLDDPLGPVGGSAVLAGLAVAAGAPLPALPHARAPVGIVTIDPGACTLCGMCAAACPTGALGYEVGARDVVLSFDAARCTACAQCVPRCPERRAGAIASGRRVDPAALAAGRTETARSSAIRCVSCGGLVAAAPLLDHLRDRLGPEHAAAHRAISARCSRCRQLPGAPPTRVLATPGQAERP